MPSRLLQRSTPVLMWSSPLLLLVLVFTVNAPTAVSHPHSTTTAVTHLAATTTTVRHASTPTTKPTVTVTTTTLEHVGTTTVVRPAPLTTTTTQTPSTTVPVLAPPAANDASSANSSATIAAQHVSGEVSLSNPLAVVAVAPGTWRLDSPGAVAGGLTCQSTSIPPGHTLLVPPVARCQVTITITSSVATTWTLQRTA